MTTQRSHFYRLFSAYLCMLSLLLLMGPKQGLAITDSAYKGTSINARPSIAIVDAPGGTRVNTFSGSLFYPRRDLLLPGRGLPIEITLNYNSGQGTIPGPFGNGWRFSYRMAVMIVGAGDVLVFWGDGRRDLFKLNGGLYKPINEGVYATLEQVAPNMFRLSTKERIQFFFDKLNKNVTSLLKQTRDPNGNTLTFAYNTLRQLTTITDASGRQILLSYTNGKVKTIKDPNTSPARVLTYSYDSNGNQTGFKDALGNVTSYVYDSSHNLTKIVDPLGTTNISYSAPRFVVSSVNRATPTGTVLSTRAFLFDTATKTTSVTDTIKTGTTAVTKYQYDAKNRLVKTTDPLGHIETRTYDTAGNIASVTDANGHTSQYTYDGKGNPLTVTDALGKTTTFTYDSLFSKLLSVTDANGHTTTFSYDGNGNLTSREDPLGATTQYLYDGFGQLTKRTNARGLATTFTYNSFGDRTAITDPLGRSTAYTYDNVGNLVSKKDAKNQITTYSYDALNRRTGIVYPDLTTATFSYDAAGNLLTATDSNSNLSFAYDANSRTTKAHDLQLSKMISYKYDGVGNRVQMTDPAGTVDYYIYDLASRLKTISRGVQKFKYSYDNGNRLIKLTLQNGSFTDASYDAANRLLSLVNRKSDTSVISSFAYQHDDVGNCTRLTLAGGEQNDYSYDAANQLVHEVRTGGASNFDHQFSYDSVGNRLQLNAGGVLTNYTYDNADELTQETTGATTTTYQYDANGNQINKTIGSNISTYSYDTRDRLVGFTSPTASASYTYDVLNRRMTKAVGATTTRFFYDGLDAVAEYDGVGVLQAQYLFGPGIDQNLAKFEGANSFYYMTDGLNSVRQVLDTTQTIRNSYDYDAWGNILAQVENVANDYTFTGRQADDESGLYYYRARLYDSSIGRFTRVDPIDINLGRSLYVYVDSNPVNRIDPLGNLPFIIIPIIIVIPILLGGGGCDKKGVEVSPETNVPTNNNNPNTTSGNTTVTITIQNPTNSNIIITPPPPNSNGGGGAKCKLGDGCGGTSCKGGPTTQGSP